MPVMDGTQATAPSARPAEALCRTTGFEWDREAPREFVERLNALWPPYGRTPWLVPFWDAGTPEEPVQRWVVYVARPASTLSENEREELQARSLEILPPGVGRESPLAVVRAMEVGIDPLPYSEAPRGRLRALGYWEAHRALVLPVWVVQGANGGHAYRWTEHERRMLRLQKLPDHEPEPGSLPFHPLDERVVTRLLALDRLRRLERFGSLGGTVMEKEAHEREWRTSFLEFMDAADHETSEMADLLSRCGVTRKDEGGLDGSEADARYVETGIL